MALRQGRDDSGAMAINDHRILNEAVGILPN